MHLRLTRHANSKRLVEHWSGMKIAGAQTEYSTCSRSRYTKILLYWFIFSAGSVEDDTINRPSTQIFYSRFITTMGWAEEWAVGNTNSSQHATWNEIRWGGKAKSSLWFPRRIGDLPMWSRKIIMWLSRLKQRKEVENVLTNLNQ